VQIVTLAEGEISELHVGVASYAGSPAAATPNIASYFASARQRAARRPVTALYFMTMGQLLCT
jgi:hypothetical protein